MGNAKYYTKYTAGSYADAFMSMPIAVSKWIAKPTGGLCKKLTGKKPEFFDWEKIQEKSPVYQTRESLREKLDTEPGVKFLQSNLLATIPFFLVGMPAAEAIDAQVNHYLQAAVILSFRLFLCATCMK